MLTTTSVESILEELQVIKVLLAEMNQYRFAEQYIDNDEFMQLMKVSRKTLQQWRKAEMIPFAQIGKKIYYRLSDIEKLFEAHFKTPGRIKKLPSQRSRIKQNPKSKGWEIST